MNVTVPIRIESTQNLREHWGKRAKRAQIHRQATFWALKAARVPQTLPSAFHVVRIAPRQLDDDNAVAGFKALRDGIADYFGVDDKNLRFTYSQEKGQPHQYAVRIELT